MTEHNHKWTWLDPVVISRDEHKSPYWPKEVFCYGVPRRCDCGIVEIVPAFQTKNPQQQAIEKEREAEKREYQRSRKEKLTDD